MNSAWLIYRGKLRFSFSYLYASHLHTSILMALLVAVSTNDSARGSACGSAHGSARGSTHGQRGFQ